MRIIDSPRRPNDRQSPSRTHVDRTTSASGGVAPIWVIVDASEMDGTTKYVQPDWLPAEYALRWLIDPEELDRNLQEDEGRSPEYARWMREVGILHERLELGDEIVEALVVVKVEMRPGRYAWFVDGTRRGAHEEVMLWLLNELESERPTIDEYLRDEPLEGRRPRRGLGARVSSMDREISATAGR